jgi:hypothetical protein
MSLSEWRAKRRRRELALMLALYGAGGIGAVWLVLVASPVVSSWVIQTSCSGDGSPHSLSLWVCAFAWALA